MEALGKPQIIAHIEKSLNYTVFDVKWMPSSAKVVVLGSHPRDTGALQVYEISNGELKLVSEAALDGSGIKPIHSFVLACYANEYHYYYVCGWVLGDGHKLIQSEKRHSFKCGSFGASSLHKRRLATGDFGGRLNIWDFNNIEAPVYSVKAHEQIVNCVDAVGGLGIGGGAPEIVTGSRDGSVKVWDPRQANDPVASMEPAEGETRRDCWTVAFGNSYNDTERCVCAGYDNGDIKMFDMRKMSCRWETNVKNGVCCLEFDRKDIPMNKLVATTLESKINVYDLRTQHPTKGFTSLSEKVPKASTLWCARHLPQNRDIFITSGGSGSVYLWKYSYPDSRVKQDDKGRDVGVVGNLTLLQNVVLSSQPISSMDWNHDKEGLLACCSFDQTVRVVIVTKLNLV